MAFKTKQTTSSESGIKGTVQVETRTQGTITVEIRQTEGGESYYDLSPYADYRDNCALCDGYVTQDGHHHGGWIRIPGLWTGSWYFVTAPCTCVIGSMNRKTREISTGRYPDWFDQWPQGMPGLTHWERTTLLRECTQGRTLAEAAAAVPEHPRGTVSPENIREQAARVRSCDL